MARPRKFNRDDALDEALNVFWTRGFEATTMTDLQKALGIGRQSLYNTFGDKTQLFDEALQKYVANTRTALDQRFPADAGVEHIRAHLHGAARGLAQEQTHRGCLIMNSCVERAAHDPRTAEQVRLGLGAMRAAFERALNHSLERGDISPETDVPAAASALLAQNAGMAVLARAGVSADELVQGVDAAMKGLLPCP